MCFALVKKIDDRPHMGETDGQHGTMDFSPIPGLVSSQGLRYVPENYRASLLLIIHQAGESGRDRLFLRRNGQQRTELLDGGQVEPPILDLAQGKVIVGIQMKRG